MPSYKTHSIHIDKSSDYIDKRIDLDVDDLKVFSFGPDSLVFSDFVTFKNQHNKNSKFFFKCLMDTIKEEKQLDNKEIISFLYGQISHFIMDYTFHPYIYYVTERRKSNYFFNSHMQLELWLDNYITNKYKVHDKIYYNKKKIENLKTRQIINKVYLKIYNSILASNKYDFGINAIKSFESDVRNNKALADTLQTVNIGDLGYTNYISSLNEFLNKNRDQWLDPVTGEIHIESIRELWNKAVSDYIETISDVNKYLYDDKPLNNELLDSNSSYDTAHNCEIPKKLIYAKKY